MNLPLIHVWSFLSVGCCCDGPPAVAGGEGGKAWGSMLERKNVKVWKSENVAYGIRETVIC